MQEEDSKEHIIGHRSHNPAGAADDIPDVTAAINVDDEDEIVHGTASVQQSHNSHPINAHHVANKGGVIKVKHYLEEESKLPERALSQADQRDTAALQLEAGQESCDVNGQDPASMRGGSSLRGDNAPVREPVTLTETTNVQQMPRTAQHESFGDDDWEERVKHGEVLSGCGITATDEGMNDKYIQDRSSDPNFGVRGSYENSGVAETPTDQGVPYRSAAPRTSGDPQRVSHSPVNESVELAQQTMMLTNDQHMQEEPMVSKENDGEAYSDDADQQDQEHVHLGNNTGNFEVMNDNEALDGGQGLIEEVDEDGAEEAYDRLDQSHDEYGVQLPPNVQPREVKKDTSVYNELEKLVVNLNHSAMANLKNDQFRQAERLLKKAEQNLIQVDNECAQMQETSDSINGIGGGTFGKREAGLGQLDALKNRLMGLTYNNLGCLCKQQQDFQGALVYLKKALDYESRLEEYEEEQHERTMEDLMEMDAADLEFQQEMRTIKCNSAGTILNICAILSKLNKHRQAHEYAKEATVKLRHSMRLTKQQVMQATRKLEEAEIKYEDVNDQLTQGEDGSSIEQDPAIEEAKTQLDYFEQQKIDLENQWVNLATTAVIAHYNAAVELEFMSLWKEALIEYERAMKLSALAMKAENPMTIKIKQAMNKMRMKVRNKVQLPDKLLLEKDKGKGRKAGKSYIGSSRFGSSVSPPNKDWQTSVNSAKSSQGNQHKANATTSLASRPVRDSQKVEPTRPQQVSNEFTVRDLESSPARFGGNNFNHPNSSLDIDSRTQQISSFDHTSQKPVSVPSSAVMGHARKVGMRTNTAGFIGSRQEKSPISLRKIIDKLEQTERQEALQLQPKSRLNRLARNFQQNTTQQHFASLGSSQQPISDLQLRQQQSASASFQAQRVTASSKNSRNGQQNFRTVGVHSSGGYDEPNSPLETSVLPKIGTQRATSRPSHGMPLSGAGRHVRGSTVSGMRPHPAEPLNQFVDRKTGTSFPKKRSTLDGKHTVNTNAWGTLTSTVDRQQEMSGAQELSEISKPSQHRRQTTWADSNNSRFNTVDVSGPEGFEITPTSLQMHLSVAQERKLIEQSKRLGQNKTRREQDINFFLGHIKRQTGLKKGKKSQRLASPTSGKLGLGPISTDLASMKAQVLMETQASNLAGSAYLPSKLKKTIKQRQLVTQIKSMQRQLIKEKQINLNSQLETAFQREMLSWKREREQALQSKLQELELQRDEQKIIDAEQEQLRARQAATEDARNFVGVAGELDQQESLSAEQAQEAVSIKHASDSKLGGTLYEQEAGDYRVSPATNTQVKAQSIEEHKHVEMAFDVNHAFTERNLEARGRAESKPATASSMQEASEYVTSQQNMTNLNTNTYADANSGTGQEVELEQRTDPKQSDTIEVEDIVSADTNNQSPLIHKNLQSFRTNSNNWKGEGGTIDRQTSELVNARINADSALQQRTGSKGVAGFQGDRNHSGAKSDLAMTHQNLDQIGQITSHEQVVERIDIVPSQSPKLADSELNARSQLGGMSSIADSQVTETVQTQRSGDYNQAMDQQHHHQIQNDSTLHEDTIDGWKVQHDNTRQGSRLDSPENGSDNAATVVETKSQIGDGPIYIKKSTDFNTSSRRPFKNRTTTSQSSLVGTITNPRRHTQLNTAILLKESNPGTVEAADRPSSRQVSDFTHVTDPVRYADKRIQDGQKVSLKHPQRTQMLMRGARDSIGQSSLAHKSEIVKGKYSSNLSIEGASVNETLSQVTQQVYSQQDMPEMTPREQNLNSDGQGPIKITSGQTEIQNVGSNNIEATYMTPRPGLTNALIKKETLEMNAFDRSSVDTDQASKKLPSRIYHSKNSRQRPPAGPSGGRHSKDSSSNPRRYVQSLANAGPQPKVQVQKPGVSKGAPKVKPLKGIPVSSSKAQPIPQMIHIKQSKDGALRTNVTSPQESVKRGAKGSIHSIQSNKPKPLALSGDNWRKSQGRKQMLNNQQPKTDNMVEGGRAWAEAETPVVTANKGIVAEDRVAKIAEKISKLNTTLLQFQTDIEEQKKDPCLKSTHRSTASKHGLASQKSRDTNMTMPMANIGANAVGVTASQAEGIAVPAHVQALQDKRLMAQLQSAPGRSRVKMTSPNYDGGMFVPGSALIKQSTKKDELVVKQENAPTVEGTVQAYGYGRQMVSPSKRSVELPTEQDMKQSQLMDVAESQIDDLSAIETPMMRSGKLSQHIV